MSDVKTSSALADYADHESENNIGNEQEEDVKEFSDIETALYFLELMESTPGFRIQGIVEMAYEAGKKMTNPHARKLLMNRITETEGR